MKEYITQYLSVQILQELWEAQQELLLRKAIHGIPYTYAEDDSSVYTATEESFCVRIPKERFHVKLQERYCDSNLAWEFVLAEDAKSLQVTNWMGIYRKTEIRFLQHDSGYFGMRNRQLEPFLNGHFIFYGTDYRQQVYICDSDKNVVAIVMPVLGAGSSKALMKCLEGKERKELLLHGSSI